MRIIVTGGAGFIGSHVVSTLIDAGHDVAVIDNLSTGKWTNLGGVAEKIKFFHADIRRRIEIDKAFVGFRPEAVAHLAAQPSLIESMIDPILDAEINIIGSLKVMAACEEFHVKRLVFASTSAAKPETHWYYSDSPDGHPDSAYGISKRAVEGHLLLNTRRSFRAVVLRFANIYGPKQLPLGENQLIARALAHIYHGADFKVFGDGQQTRDFLYVEDVAEAVLHALVDRWDMGGAFNISSGISRSVNEILTRLWNISERAPDWEYDGGNILMRGRWHVDMPNDSFRREFLWRPQVDISEGLALTVEWWRHQKKPTIT